MPFVPVPKDLSKIKSKVAFNLTKRQLICFGVGSILGIPTYLTLHTGIGNDLAALLMIGLMLPFFAFGIYEKDGKPLEKVIWNFISVSFLRPSVRPFRTDNGYAALMRQYEYDREVDKIESKKAGKVWKNEKHRNKTPQSKTGSHIEKK